MLEESAVKAKILAKVDKNLTKELNNNKYFAQKLQWAKEFVKDRNIIKEIEEAEMKDRITKPQGLLTLAGTNALIKIPHYRYARLELPTGIHILWSESSDLRF
jgi:hypothetical protein